MWLQSLIKASFLSQTFSWMLISLPHLLLLCLSSTSLCLSPPLVLSPHLSATQLPVLLLPLPLFSPPCSHLLCALTACLCVVGVVILREGPWHRAAWEEWSVRGFAPTNRCANDAHGSHQHIKEVPSAARIKSIVVVPSSSIFFLLFCAYVIVKQQC